MWWWFWCCHLSMYIKKIRITSSPYVSFFTILYFFIPIYFVTENIYLNNKTNTFDTCCSSTNMSHQLVPAAIILIYILYNKRRYVHIYWFWSITKITSVYKPVLYCAILLLFWQMWTTKKKMASPPLKIMA